MATDTVRIQDAGFPAGLLINKEDYDEKKHQLYVESDLPQDLPGRDHYVRAGINFAQLRELDEEGLLAVDGIDTTGVAELKEWAKAKGSAKNTDSGEKSESGKPSGDVKPGSKGTDPEGDKTKGGPTGAIETEATHASLMKRSKSELIDLAKAKGLEFPVPDDVTREVIANAILAAK